MDDMSTRLYRRVAAAALVTTVGLSLAACGSSKNDSASGGKTTITVDCPPLKTDNGGKSLEAYKADIAAFEKANPTIDIESISVGAQCDNPPDFTARLQGGTEADVFYAYMTDMNQVLDADAAADITKYITKDTVPNWDQISDNIKKPFIDSGKTYGIGYAGYTMGLVYNKALFTKAGLDPAKAPMTWQDVATDAKAISKAVPGAAGYEDYSAGNTGGWHFTAELYSRGGADVSSDGKTATVNTPEAAAVLTNLHNMRFTDNSVGVKQLKTWPDLLTDAGAGKVGMYIGAPDTITAIVTQFHGKYEDWNMGPMPGDAGPAKGTLGGGSGYMFKKTDTPAQIEAGLKWITFEELTPGQGAANYALQKSENLAVGLPEPAIWTNGSAMQKQDDALKAASSNLDPSAFAQYVANPVPVVVEPPQAQAIYQILDGVMSAVLTQQNANIQQLLNTANGKIQSQLSSGS
jgi:ABC-type glycerol-3-phosphate transport system substrate-binding protein